MLCSLLKHFAKLQWPQKAMTTTKRRLTPPPPPPTPKTEKKRRTSELSSYTLHKNIYTPFAAHRNPYILISVFAFYLLGFLWNFVAILFTILGVRYSYKLRKLLGNQLKWITFVDGYSRELISGHYYRCRQTTMTATPLASK